MIWFLYPVFLIPRLDESRVLVAFNVRGGMVDVRIPTEGKRG